MIDERQPTAAPEPEDARDAAAQPGADGESGSTESVIESLTAQLEETRAEKDRFHRAYSDAVTYSRRADERHADDLRYAATPILTQLLSVLDDLERAFAAMPATFQQVTWVEGLLLIYRKLMTQLEAHGVKEIEGAGQPFDPNLHEAVSRVAGPEGRIVEVLQRGYLFHERLLRPVLALVGDGSGDQQPMDGAPGQDSQPPEDEAKIDNETE